MSRIIDTILKHLAIVSLLAAIVVIAGLVVWAALSWIIGVTVSPLLPIAAVAAALAWSMSRENSHRPPPPAPPAPRRPLTEAEVKALLELHARGIITTAELRLALGDLVPPSCISPIAGGTGKGRRQ